MSREPQPLLFLMPSIRGGGMERLASILLRGLDRERYRPELIVLHRRDENESYRASIPDDVRVDYLDKRSRLDVPRAVGFIARRYEEARPQAAIGLMTYANLLLLGARMVSYPRVPVIATEHVTPDALKQTRGKRAQLAAAGKLYRQAAAVVTVSEGVRRAFIDELNLPPSLIHAIYNPYDPTIGQLLAEEGTVHPWLGEQGPTLVAVGRLEAQKAYPVLLHALERVRRQVPARLLILGEGSERGRLETLAGQLGLDEAVAFLGFVANPFRHMRDADAFVLSSDWETLGFVLVEASRAGAAIVSTDCPFGPDEVIEPERTGLLVPPRDPAALAAAILRVLREPGLAERLRTGALERSAAFAPDEALRRYTELIEAVTSPLAAGR